MAQRPTPPKYRKQAGKTGDRAFVELGGVRHYLGVFGSEESRECYGRLIAEWQANGGQLPLARNDITITECVAAYWQFAQGYYRKHDRPTTEVSKIRIATRVLIRLYGSMRATSFGPLSLKACRQTFIATGNSRSVVNEQTFRIRRIFKWCVSEELIPERVYHGLQTVQSLRRGRSEAWETKRVIPVPDEYVDAIRPYVSRQVWAIVELQRLTGMRSGEVVIMRGCNLDMTGKLWLYHPESHKTEHHGHERVVEIGPRSQAVIKPFLKPDLEAPLFSPADVDAEHRAKLTAKRKTPLSCGNRPGTNRKPKPKRTPRERYDTDSYGRAIARACKLAQVPMWNPHRLRHLYGSKVRKEFGIETCRILLGHKSAVTSELYAEIDRTKARAVVSRIG